MIDFMGKHIAFILNTKSLPLRSLQLLRTRFGMKSISTKRQSALNTSKTWLRQRINHARQQLKLLKNKEAWSAPFEPVRLKPDSLRFPRRSRAGAMTLREALLATLISIILLSGLVCLIISGVQKFL